MKKAKYIFGIVISVLFGLGLGVFLMTSHKQEEISSPKKELVQKDSHSTKPSSSENADRQKDKTEAVASAETSSAPENQEKTRAENSQASYQSLEEVKSHSTQEGGSKHRLEVTQQVQRAWNTCAPTTVSMILSSRGISVSQESLARDMGTDESFGTHNADAIRILNRYLFGYDSPRDNQSGYRLATVTTSDPNSSEMKLFKERLKQNIKDGYPMYYTFDNARIYPGSKGEHNVIGTGYQLTEDGTDIAYIYYIDPSYTQQDAQYGGLKKITPEQLFYAMLTCVEPNYAW